MRTGVKISAATTGTKSITSRNPKRSGAPCPYLVWSSNFDPLTEGETVHTVPECSHLYHAGEINDYCWCYAVHIHSGDVNIDKVSESFFSIAPKWFHRLLRGGPGQTAPGPLLKRNDEVIFGANLKRMELRVSILEDAAHSDLFHFTLLINFNTIIGKCCFRPFGIISAYLFKTTLKNLERSFKDDSFSEFIKLK